MQSIGTKEEHCKYIIVGFMALDGRFFFFFFLNNNNKWVSLITLPIKKINASRTRMQNFNS